MQNFKTLRQPLLGELAMSWREERKKERREKNAIYSGHLRLCQQPRAAHALRSDQLEATLAPAEAEVGAVDKADQQIGYCCDDTIKLTGCCVENTIKL